MTDFIRETRTLELLPDDQIRQSIREQMQKLDGSPESMVLTWRKGEMEYFLELVFAGGSRLTVGRIHTLEYDALNRLTMAGRRLYFRLRGDFPVLQRKLSRYQYQTLP